MSVAPAKIECAICCKPIVDVDQSLRPRLALVAIGINIFDNLDFERAVE
jgi:hypothetical protein